MTVFFASLLSLLLSTGEANCIETEDHARHWFGRPNFSLNVGGFSINSRTVYWVHRPPSREMYYFNDQNIYGVAGIVCVGLVRCEAQAYAFEQTSSVKLSCTAAK